MNEKLSELKSRLQEVTDLNLAAAVLNWDQATYMPAGGAPARGRQMALLGRIAQEMFIDPAVGKLLDDLQPYAEGLPFDDDDASLVRVARREYERAIKVPPSFLEQVYAHGAESYQVWADARPKNDFAAVQPYLRKTIEFSRQLADYFPGYAHIADPLIDFSDYGMTVASLRDLFANLRQQLVPIVEAIARNPSVEDAPLHQTFPEQKQLEFGLSVIKDYGYDFNRGRQDKTHHPFMTKFSLGDVRITTRVKENDLSEALFSTLHESGHAMYEQGIDMKYEGTPLGNGTSAGIHESQSRLWENQVGRSRAFWNHYYPALQRAFPEQLGSVSQDAFYRAINKVQPSLIRTDADEVTYNLHVIIRFELELELLEGKLDVKDLPQAWHDRYEAYLGVHAPSDVDGVLQDVHWYGGLVGGAFQGYTLGNVMAAAFFEKAQQAHPDIPAQIAEGQFGTLHGWLRDNVYRHGSKYTATELLQHVLGQPLTIDPYIRYLRTKFGALYAL